LQLKPGPIGKTGASGATGATGATGAHGKDGRGIKAIAIDDRGDLVVEFTDGTRTVTGRVVGRDGATGATGATGKPGVVSIEFTENGKTLSRVSDVKSGSLVRQPIQRFIE
jgi:hypothetical protein